MRKNHPFQRLRRHFMFKIMASFALAILLIVGFTNTLILHKERKALLDNMALQGKRTAAFLNNRAKLTMKLICTFAMHTFVKANG